MNHILTDAAVETVARNLGCAVPAIRAVIDVEAGGAGFFDDGRPKILFERHIFSHRTKGQFDASNPLISSPHAGGYLGGVAEYPRLYAAIQLDPAAAIESASWGIAQIMGFNWQLCGEKSLMGFVMAMHNSADMQLFLFAEFLRRTNLEAPLRANDWKNFAIGYNGPGYDKLHYDVKLANAYDKHRVTA